MHARHVLAVTLALVAVAGCGADAAGLPRATDGNAGASSAAPQAAPPTRVAPSIASGPQVEAPSSPAVLLPSHAGAGPNLAGGGPLARQSDGTVAFDLYRPGVYAMQATWEWCTSAAVEIMRNVAHGEADHAASDQGRYFDYMRGLDRYSTPVTEGVDPVGFQAGLRQFVDPRYSVVASPTFAEAVRSAVTHLRLTSLPVAVLVDTGRHAWVLTGFTATADPASTAAFRVVSVRVVGPLYGRQSLNGYDPPPDTDLPYDTFRQFLLPYHFKFGPTPWDRQYVTFQAVSGSSSRIATARPT